MDVDKPAAGDADAISPGAHLPWPAVPPPAQVASAIKALPDDAPLPDATTAACLDATMSGHLATLDDLQMSCMLLAADAIVRHAPGYGKTCVVAGGLPLKAFLRTRMRASEAGETGGLDQEVLDRFAAAKPLWDLRSDLDVFIVNKAYRWGNLNIDYEVPSWLASSAWESLTEKQKPGTIGHVRHVLKEKLGFELVSDDPHYPDGDFTFGYTDVSERNNAELKDEEVREWLAPYRAHLPAGTSDRIIINGLFNYVYRGRVQGPDGPVYCRPFNLNIISLDPRMGDAVSAICQFDLTPTMVAFGPAPARPKEFSYLFGSGLTLQHIERGLVDFTPTSFQPSTEHGRREVWRDARPRTHALVLPEVLRAVLDGPGHPADADAYAGGAAGGAPPLCRTDADSARFAYSQIQRQLTRAQKYESRGWSLPPAGRSWGAGDAKELFAPPPRPRYAMRLSGLLRAAAVLAGRARRARARRGGAS